MTARERIGCRRKFFFFDFYPEGFMKRITIKSIAVLLVLGLAACGSLRTGSTQAQKDSTGGSNVAQVDTRPTPGAQDVNQRATDARVTKQRPNNAKSPGAIGATQHIRFAKAKIRRGVKKQVEYVEYRIIETEDVAPLAIEVMPPTKVIKTQTVQVVEPSVAPTVIVDVNETIVRPQARSVYVASPVSPECSTVYGTWVEYRDP